MKISTDARLPNDDDIRRLKTRLVELHREVATQLNLASEGAIQASHNAMTAAPLSGDYRVGDFVRNSAPSELGTAGSKYLIFGWSCVASGSPGTWKQCRFLTGG